jgi:hypothetical protein
MVTYSINNGTVTETSSLANLNDVLNQLPNNTSHLVSPRDVRDAIYTTWTNNVFKPTTITASVVGYIGFDSSVTGLTIRQKIFLGKRNLLGQDILNNSLLTSDTDIFVYNTKVDSSSQDSTKIRFLAGASSSFHSTSPYLQSLYVVGATSNFIDFNLKNESGNINISSSNKSVSINGLLFPTESQNFSSPDGYVLKKIQVGSQSTLQWNDIGTLPINALTSSGTVSITGSPVLINGNPIVYTNPTPTLASLGGVSIGETFSNVALVTMLNKLLYPYFAASASIILIPTVTIASGVTGSSTREVIVEPSNLSALSYVYNITNRSYPITSILSSPVGSLPPLTTRLFGTSSISVPLSSQVYQIQVTDGTQSTTATASLTFTYPYFWGVTTSSINFNNTGTLPLVNKLMKSKSNTDVLLVGSQSYIYFLYPSVYGDLTKIIDTDTGFNYISSFTKIHNAITMTSSSPAWSTSYNIYSYTSGSGKTTVNSIWSFKY